MDNNEIIRLTCEFARRTFEGAEGGHDWFHTERVWKTARHLAEEEKADLFVVELAALLHDIADAKFNGGDDTAGPRIAGEFLTDLCLDQAVVDHVRQIIFHVSFKGGNEKSGFSSPELLIVQDADRLDAIGAIGIARTFNYGGHKGRAIYDPSIQPVLTMSKEEYRNSTAPTLNHFYEKLLLLRDRMNTRSGKAMATARHDFMLSFLEQFYREWEGRI
jgi:uncharacterized protein